MARSGTLPRNRPPCSPFGRERTSVVQICRLDGTEEVETGVALFSIRVRRRPLVAAERHVEFQAGRLLVHLRDARLDVLDEPMSLREVVRNDTGGQAELNVVCDGHRLLEVRYRMTASTGPNTSS